MSQYNIWNNTQQNPLHQVHQPPQQPAHHSDQLSPDLLIAKLNNLSSSQNYNSFVNSLNTTIPSAYQDPNYAFNNSYNNEFHLPLELQGGLSNIQSRRPSYTADQITYNHFTNSDASNNNHVNSLESYVHHNNFNNNLGVNFRSRRPSIQIQSNSLQNTQPLNNPPPNDNINGNGNPVANGNNYMELENGLLLQNGYIITSTFLQKNYYETTKNYFCVEDATRLYEKLQYHVLNNEVIQKIIINLKKLNNLFNLVKPLTLILTKSGKFEILSTPLNSNLRIVNRDVVISDGDRGKDLVFVLEANLGLEMAILINYLKKKQHARAISYTSAPNTTSSNNNSNNNNNNGFQPTSISNTVEDLLSGNGILDEETQFQIPSKQILRFATPNEITNLKFKLVEEIKSYKTAVLKINQNAQLRNSLEILTSEYQFDQKKLTFYYRSLERLDFRGLIKELFKIYKTRIWLCAVVNIEGNTINSKKDTSDNLINGDEIDLATHKNDYFHVRIFERLFDELLEL